jgi:hypothetical protein
MPKSEFRLEKYTAMREEIDLSSLILGPSTFKPRLSRVQTNDIRTAGIEMLAKRIAAELMFKSGLTTSVQNRCGSIGILDAVEAAIGSGMPLARVFHK